MCALVCVITRKAFIRVPDNLFTQNKHGIYKYVIITDTLRAVILTDTLVSIVFWKINKYKIMSISLIFCVKRTKIMVLCVIIYISKRGFVYRYTANRENEGECSFYLNAINRCTTSYNVYELSLMLTDLNTFTVTNLQLFNADIWKNCKKSFLK